MTGLMESTTTVFCPNCASNAANILIVIRRHCLGVLSLSRMWYVRFQGLRLTFFGCRCFLRDGSFIRNLLLMFLFI